MKPEAQKILKMIEAVDPADAAAMDEIDARVWNSFEKVRQGDAPVEFLTEECGEIHQKGWTTTNRCGPYSPPRFTRSIDAQDILRREGKPLRVYIYKDGKASCLFGRGDEIQTSKLPTEPLARLHAWVQILGMEG